MAGVMVGIGMRAAIFSMSGFKRLLGMILPAKGALPLVGSVMMGTVLLPRIDCEKSPSRSSAVGTVAVIEAGLWFFHNSSPTKKNSFSLLGLNHLGVKTGPPAA